MATLLTRGELLLVHTGRVKFEKKKRLKTCLHVPSPLSGSFDIFDVQSDGQKWCGTHFAYQSARHH